MHKCTRRRQRPRLCAIAHAHANLQIGQLVYAKVAVAHKHLEPELTCVNATTNKADGFGELKNGMMIRCFSSTARALLQRKHPILEFLGDQFAYELAVGMNGRVWVHSRRAADTVVVANAIVQTERIAAGNVAEMKRVVMTLLHSAAMDVSTA